MDDAGSREPSRGGEHAGVTAEGTLPMINLEEHNDIGDTTNPSHGNDEGSQPRSFFSPKPLEDDDEEDESWMDPSHPLLSRPLVALERQLSKQNADLDLTLSEKNEAVARAKKRREEIGVELYNFQRQLAKLQMSLERTHEEYSVVHRLRAQAEDDLKAVTLLYKEKEREHKELKNRWIEAHRELDKLNATVHQIEEFNRELKSDIKATRRQAYGTEEQMQKVEKEKARQDLEIDRLTEQLTQSETQLRLIKDQLEAQAGSTDDAQATLREATGEMEAIKAEKKEFLHKWQESLVKMSRRDQLLQQAFQAKQQHEEKALSLETEIGGYSRSIKDEQHQLEKLAAVLGRLQTETKFVTNQITSLEEKKRDLTEQYELLQKSLEQTDSELRVEEAKSKRLQQTADALAMRKEKLSQQKQRLEDQIMENTNDQTTIEKGAQNVYRTTQKLRSQIHAKELEINDVQNELARIRVDALNTEAHNKELESTKAEFLAELKEKDKLIEKYELEIRQRHDQIEKQQIYIVRLNRKYDSLTANQEEENTGPLESTIKHLNKEIEEKQKESSDMQRDWIRTQTALVASATEAERKRNKLAELHSKQTVMKQKQLRTIASHEQQRQQVKELQASIRALHTSTGKLNELLAKNKSLEEELSRSNYTLESEFMENLRELEDESSRLQARIEKLKADKETLFQDIVEVERQIMLWEKKIQLEKETQAALDPEHGQPEIRGMKKEIHRMELRLSQLQRQQEKMIQEMERTIEKQESIKLMHTSAKSRKHLTQATLKKKIMEYKQALKQNAHEAKRVDNEIKRQDQDNGALLEQLEAKQTEYGRLEDRKLDVVSEAELHVFKKEAVKRKARLIQESAAAYRRATAGTYRTSRPLEHDRLQERISKEENRLQRIKAATQGLRERHPQYDDWIDSLLTLV